MPFTNQSKDINASVSEVWSKFTDFHDLSWAPHVITKVEKVGNLDGMHKGSKRVLNDAFHETLIEIDHRNHVLKYSIDDGPSPISKEEVSNYCGVVKLSPIDNDAGTHVEWSSSWNSKGEEAVEFCHGIYVALLNDLDESSRH